MFGEPLARPDVSRNMTIEFHFTPELHLKDGRIIRDLNDAVSSPGAATCVIGALAYDRASGAKRRLILTAAPDEQP
jgi:hypothetical protein